MNAEQKRLYRLKANVIAAAGNPIRLAIIDFLKDGEQCVCDIADHVERVAPPGGAPEGGRRGAAEGRAEDDVLAQDAVHPELHEVRRRRPAGASQGCSGAAEHAVA